jgi:prevent-host-death family protein
MALNYERNRVTAERQIAATEARVHFGELTRDVERTGEHVLVERNGHPVVVVVPVEEFRRLQRRRDNEELLASLRETRDAWQEAFRGVDMPSRRGADPRGSG